MRYAMWLFDTDWKGELFKRLDALSEKLGVPGWYQRLVDKGLINNVSLNR